MNIAILGGGCFGTALAVHFSKFGHDIKIWEFIKEQVDEMNTNRICPLIPEIQIPDEIIISNEFSDVIPDSDIVLVVVPSDKVDITLKNAQELIKDKDIIICSKGFGNDQSLLSDICKKYTNGNIYCLYGPTIAKELVNDDLTGMILAGEDSPTDLKKKLEGGKVRIEISNDIVGVQVGSALKNVVTILIGIVEGLELGENTKSYIFVRGLKEIEKIGLSLGAKSESFYSYTGLGDLLLNSRNRKLGIEIGKGKTLEEVLANKAHVSEGVIAIKNAVKIAEKNNIDVPLINGLYRILFDNLSPIEFINSL